MSIEMNVDKALGMVEDVCADRIRWGKHGGFNAWTEQDVLDALICMKDAGVFVDAGGAGTDLRADIVASNRSKGAAEARASKYKGQLDHANEQVLALTIALEDAQAQLDSAYAEQAIEKDGDYKA